MVRALVLATLSLIAFAGCSKGEERPITRATPAAASAQDPAAPSSAANNQRDVVGAQQLRATDGTRQTEVASQPSQHKATEDTAQGKHAQKTSRTWTEFDALRRRCAKLSETEKQQCILDTRDTYVAWNLNCEDMKGADRAPCREYVAQWNAAKLESATSDTSAVHTGEPNVAPAEPGDTTSEERNRDSTLRPEIQNKK
jgi:hypothetical protein